MATKSKRSDRYWACETDMQITSTYSYDHYYRTFSVITLKLQVLETFAPQFKTLHPRLKLQTAKLSQPVLMMHMSRRFYCLKRQLVHQRADALGPEVTKHYTAHQRFRSNVILLWQAWEPHIDLGFEQTHRSSESLRPGNGAPLEFSECWIQSHWCDCSIKCTIATYKKPILINQQFHLQYPRQNCRLAHP